MMCRRGETFEDLSGPGAGSGSGTGSPSATVGNQRWTAGRDSYRPPEQPIDPSRYGVELIDSDNVARDFVCTHHYSGSYPAARCRVGLYRTTDVRHNHDLVGVAVFSVPMSSAALRKHTSLDHNGAVELGRFVLLDEVPGNGETWFLARAFSALQDKLPEIRAVLSYSDPVPRTTASGDTVLPGHVGTIYQAHNGRYVGRSKPRSLVLGPDGSVVSARALSKLRNGRRGEAYAYQQLIDLGAPKRRPLESGRDYVKRALSEGPFCRKRHPGNHAYVWAVGNRRQRRRAEPGLADPLPYPKRRAA